MLSRHEADGQHSQAASSLLGKASAAYRNGQLDHARRLLEQAIALDFKSAGAHALLGLILARQNELQSALLNLRLGHELDPANADYAYDYALLLLQDRRFSSAAPILESLHRRSPQARDVVINLARAYAGAQESAKLARLSADLPSADYRDERLLETLGAILGSSGQTAAAERLWKAAIDHNANLPLPYAALAEMWTAHGEARRASALLAGAPPAARGPLYVYAQGQAQRALGKYDQSIQSFQMLTRELPANQSAWMQLVTTYLVAGRLQQAEQVAGQASRRFPGATEFPYQRAVANYMLGRSSTAIGELAPVIAKEQESDARALLLMAVLESETGNYPLAIRYFAQVERMSPGCNALGSYFYGATLLRLHQLQAAQGQFKAAVHCRPHFALAEFRLGQALAQSGNLQQASAALLQATHDNPGLAEAYYALARIRRRAGDPQGAQAALRRFNSLRGRVTHSDRDLFAIPGSGATFAEDK